eukprot:TRINITY_DN5029_c0_g1_i1.p1 TRINITY_DN5029_c0_g1~~TRINITY_DN5029_c0_g1_i1.p1  ORF type:complete len:263 (+),score=53.16 TRINITY_DN5029_c0_g1_i1:123-911(+)
MCIRDSRVHGTRICLTFTDYHPESWQPAWTIRTMLQGIISFMPFEDTAGSIGALNYSVEERKKLAKNSLSYTCDECGKIDGIIEEMKNTKEGKPVILPSAPRVVFAEPEKDVPLPEGPPQEKEEKKDIITQSNDKEGSLEPPPQQKEPVIHEVNPHPVPEEEIKIEQKNEEIKEQVKEQKEENNESKWLNDDVKLRIRKKLFIEAQKRMRIPNIIFGLCLILWLIYFLNTIYDFKIFDYISSFFGDSPLLQIDLQQFLNFLL